MTQSVLWKRLTATDFHAMHAEASPHGHGGGARHIALGVRSNTFPVDEYLGAQGKSESIVLALAPAGDSAPLEFYSNPDRRGGEWTIRNQFSHRHPAWSAQEGFPTAYDGDDPPYVLIFNVNGDYYARFALEMQLDEIWKILPEAMLSDGRGIAPSSPELLLRFSVPVDSLISAFERHADQEPGARFDPSDVEDGRRKVFTSIVERQGQADFRQTLINAYQGKCAITQETTLWVLEAAHVSPYKGPDTNRPQNGLLLRSDVHTLFDVGLVSIRPVERLVLVSSALKDSAYWQFNNRPLPDPTPQQLRPSEAALAQHFSQFRE